MGGAKGLASLQRTAQMLLENEQRQGISCKIKLRVKIQSSGTCASNDLCPPASYQGQALPYGLVSTRIQWQELKVK